MKIIWVNHASFVFEHKAVRLLVDPWLDGRVFDNSWALLSKTIFAKKNFESITHLWFSHEHPDHFHPETLKKIPESLRLNIKVIFQTTRDKKVINYLHSIGFTHVMEVESDKWLRLSPEVEMLVHPMPFWGDSWACYRTPDGAVLNLNDCAVNTEQEIQAVKKIVGDVTVLLTQFSYASFVGNAGDDAAMSKKAREFLENIHKQIRLLNPKYVIPFASFIWFCHTENFYMNKHANTVFKANEAIDKVKKDVAIILYPGEEWVVGAKGHSNQGSLDKYADDYRKLFTERKLTESASVRWLELKKSGSDFLRKIWGLNKTLMLLKFRACFIFIEDFGWSIKVSFLRGVRRCKKKRDYCDVALNSSALHYCFSFLWGGDTLFVNGRYFVPPYGRYENFRAYFNLASEINRGKKYPGIPNWICARLKKYIC